MASIQTLQLSSKAFFQIDTKGQKWMIRLANGKKSHQECLPYCGLQLC